MEDLHRTWHSQDRQDVLDSLETNSETGLKASDLEARLSRFGPNELPAVKQHSSLAIFLQQFRSPLIYILFIAAVFAFALGKRGDALVILIVVFINALIGWFQEGRAARAMEALRQLSAQSSRVLRDGQEKIIASRSLVPGDIVLLASGDGVGADARLLISQGLEVAEATLTGESLPVRKTTDALPADTLLADRINMVYSGTYITAGRGTAVVTDTGSETEVGHIARDTHAATPPKTPLELSIAQFGRYLVAGAVVLFVAVMALGLMRGMDTIEIFMVAISQMVSMVPEGLPVAMTIALSVGMQRMAARGAIVRRLAAVETLGSTSVICADKTGTLTRNEMTVTALWLPPGRMLRVEGAGYQPIGRVLENGQSLQAQTDSALNDLLQAAVLCNDARLLAPDTDDPRWRILGDPTEAALLTLAHKADLDVEAVSARLPRQAELPFDPSASMMATAHQPAGCGCSVVFLKGAPEAILAQCGYSWKHGAAESLDNDDRLAVIQAAEQLADEALRVLAFARLDDCSIKPGDQFKDFSGRLLLLGLVGEMDPPREEVKESVAQCKAAGMRPVMVTGDHKHTGLAVARTLGIAREGDWAIDGRELQNMQESDLRADINRIAVFARVHPAQKLRIVEAFQSRGEVVAMTGDGVNDAPALVRADVGVAMGQTGTEVAKTAAEIVITDDNFSTIVDAIQEGRLVHNNLRKVILYLFATSMAEIAVLMSALLLGYPLPLAAVQILWINIVTEGTVTVNLIMEPPEGNEMRHKPVDANRPLLSRDLLKRVALMTPVMALSTFAYFTWRLSSGAPYAQVQTETFTVLAACQWFNVLNCQSATRSVFSLGIFRNPWMAGGLLLSILLQGLVVYWPVMQQLFHTVPIAPWDLLLIALCASSVMWAEEIRKVLVRRIQARNDMA